MTAHLPATPATSSPGLDVGEQAVSAVPPSWPWRRSALLLAGAAQLITISALVGSEPPAASWPRLLLAVAPAPLAAAAAFLPQAWRPAAAAVACVVLVVGIAGGFLPTGVLFLPALVAMIGAGARSWSESSSPAARTVTNHTKT